MSKRDRAIIKRAKALGVDISSVIPNRPQWALCAHCGDIISPSQKATQRFKPITYKGVNFPHGIWVHDLCVQGTLRWYKHLGRPVAGFEVLFNQESDERFLRWYSHLLEQERKTKMQAVAAICEPCSMQGLDMDTIKKCERCGRGCCPHRARDGMCAPCWVAAKENIGGDGPKEHVYPEQVPQAKANPFPKSTKAPPNEISAALNGKTHDELTAIANANGVGKEWAGWSTKFSTNMGMARMQLNGALRRIQAKGVALVFSPASKTTPATVATKSDKAQRERAFAAHKKKVGKKK